MYDSFYRNTVTLMYTTFISGLFSTRVIYVKKFAYIETELEIMVRVMVFNATFNNISVISWWSVVLVEETAVPVEIHQPVASH